jgi:hypothetical protein
MSSPPAGGRAVRPAADPEPLVSYAGRGAALATKHDKLPLIAPALGVIGLDVVVAAVDTDRLGTFTGEIPRPGPPLETAVAKARLGMGATGTPLGLASEGSIGPHPASPLLVVDVEIVVLVDDDRDVVVWAVATGTDVVAAAQAVEPGQDLTGLPDRFDLPEHAAIVRPNQGLPPPVLKGLRRLADIEAAVAACAAASPDGRARVETDLRAHVCPSRRPVIRLAAERLAERLAARCPVCASPGWGPVDAVRGIPCAWCATPVDAVRAEIDGCPACGHRAERAVVARGVTADPGRCPRCNP